MDRIRKWVKTIRTSWVWNRTLWLLKRASQSYILIVILGIIIGLQVAPAIGSFAADPVTGTVMVIPLHGSIDGQSSAVFTSQLQQAREDPSIDAVVIHINSGGGASASSQEIYMAISKTSEEMPVIAVVDAMAASGAYHAAVGADEIYVKPASFVGNVGVFLTLPQDIPPVDGLVTTGPEKLTGAEEREWYYKVQSVKNAFLGAVMENRDEQLELSRDEVASGELWTGSEAVSYGVADRIGTLEDAIDRAGNDAGLAHYDVEIMAQQQPVQFVTQVAYAASDAEEKEMISPTYFIGHPDEQVAPNIVMLPPSVVRVAMEEHNMTAVSPTEVTTNETTAP